MKSKNLSNKILKTIKSRGFKFIELPPVIEADIFFKDQVKILENTCSLSIILMVKNLH